MHGSLRSSLRTWLEGLTTPVLHLLRSEGEMPRQTFNSKNRDAILGGLMALEREHVLTPGQLKRALSKLAKEGDSIACIVVVEMMFKHHISPTRRTIGDGLKACALCGDVVASRWFRDLSTVLRIPVNRSISSHMVVVAVSGLSVGGFERAMSEMREAGHKPPACFLRRLLTVLHRTLRPRISCSEIETQRALVRYQELWLAWFLVNDVPMDTSSSRLLLSQVAPAMHKLQMRPSSLLHSCLWSRCARHPGPNHGDVPLYLREIWDDSPVSTADTVFEHVRDLLTGDSVISGRSDRKDPSYSSV